MQKPDWLAEEVKRALDEDIGSGDLSASLIPHTTQARATLIAREEAILCGRQWLEEVFHQLGGQVRIDWNFEEGDLVPTNGVICHLHGQARSLLSGERTALNFLQTLMATATLTYRYVHELDHAGTRLLDTRKTLPGLRRSQKYAVQVGGGVNHRMGLYDAIMIKENHIMAAGSITAAVQAARERFPDTFVEVEVENLHELDEALSLPVDRIMLDNFTLKDIETAVLRAAGRIPLEVSGNVSFEDLSLLAQTGVDFVSIGALTKHIQAIDLSMRFELETPCTEH